MDIRKLQRAIVDGLEDVKAQDIVVFNTEHLSPLFERVIIASGTSNRQTKALASSVRETVKSRGLPVLRTEGEDNGEWIIVDCGAAVAHIMQPQIREYYHLEEIWGGKPVRMRLGDVRATALPKASADTGVAARPSARARPAANAAPRTPAKPGKRTAAPAAGRGTRAAAAASQAKAAGGRRTSAKTASSPASRPASAKRVGAAKKAAPRRRGG